ncbi:MAG: hypothetical protein ACFFA3_15565 [Promethearchaeota archaeon]
MTEDRYIKVPEDITFLLELCRVLLRRIRTDNPNQDIPVSINELKRLRSLEEIYSKLEYRIINREELLS